MHTCADARLLLLHGHSDRPADAKHRRADVASHFVLRFACCGGAVGAGLRSEGESGERKERREEDADWRRDRREWFVRAERDLFESRLHSHLHNVGMGGKNDEVCLDKLSRLRGTVWFSILILVGTCA